MGDVPSAVDDYPDIPAPTRARLKARMEKLAYDDIVSIRRDTIEGGFDYEPALLGMHFGERRMCAQVTRNSWQPGHKERALAYCEDGHCVVVPMACRNVSRVIRRPAIFTPGTQGAGPEPLTFEAPGAGLPATPEEPAAPLARTPLAQPPAATPLPPGMALPPTPLEPLPPAFPAPSGPPAPAWPPFAGIPPLPPAPAVPEPATALLWVVGLAAGALWRRGLSPCAARSRTGRSRLRPPR